MSSIRRRTVFRGSSPAVFVKLVVLAVVSAGLMLTGPAAQTATQTAAQTVTAAADAAKIKPKLSRQLEAKGEASFWIRFDQADLSSANKVADWTERGKVVYDTLKAAASESQKDTRALLDGEDVTYQAFWATNAIRVEAGDFKLALKIAHSSDVVALYPTFDYRLEKPIKGKPVHEVDAVEWGVANINADDVWSQFGITGEGITVASIDTGAQFDHPALVDQYRGNIGDGTFDHNYNWFDAAGSCPDAPCDNDGHGTHTMGTMLGDDGGENQIGVAPGANWIEANGCCPSDAALVASGEWMLAPTDLAGENADVSKRPNIINNSWGTQQPSNDPFMEDIELAWAASGIWGQWSNGNSGSACETSGSPGSRIINYSSGAYDIDNEIADFSARGPGQDGEIKPNISAPGVNVRSSFPGNTYGSISGTSMASPHVAGAVALLWSAAPALIGDIEGTWALLDGTSVDTDDAQCGGTADDNNVYGEGRLDALALVNAAPVGDTGTLAGTVTDSATGDPLADATVEITGDFNRTVTTEDDGSYSIRLAAGDYTATASKFGYGNESADVTIAAEQTTTQDFALTVSPSVTLSGTVTDGSGHGWPLYAAIDVAGPGADVYTDPVTGDYSVSLPSNATYTVSVDSQYPGYTSATFDVTIGDADATQDAALEVDATTCTAAGYEVNVDGVTEDFNSGELPDGWTIQDNLGNGQVWQFDDPGARRNLTGGDGGFAIVDSDFYGDDGTQDTALVSPVVDMSALTAPAVGFRQDYNNLGDVADVDLSIDGGATWTTVLHQTADARGPRQDFVQLPAAAGQSSVQVRFHYYDAAFAWWWEIDDVFVGDRTCDPISGGLVVGNVRDTRTSAGVNGATVTSLDKPAEAATSMATPDDAALDDGFYWIFSTLTGSHRFEAKANQYQLVSKQVVVAVDDAVQADFSLASGHLKVSPLALSASKGLRTGKVTKNFKVTNDGAIPVDLEFTERKGGFVILGADGSRTDAADIAGMDGAPLLKIKAPTSLARRANDASANGAPAVNGPHDAPWTDIADYPVTVMDNRVVNVDGVAYSVAGGDGSASSDAVYAYDPATLSWTAKAGLPEPRNAVAAAVIDGQIVVTGGWAESEPSPATWVYDPASDAWTPKADAPVSLSASGQAVVDGKLYTVGGCTTSACVPMSEAVSAYDPASNTWGSLADYPDTVAFASCGAIDGMVYCTGGNNGEGGTAASYVYDPGADTWTPIANAPADSWASANAVANGTLVVNGGVQGEAITNDSFAYDPAAGAWIDMPNSNTARYRGGAACGLYKIGGSSGGFEATVDSETLPGFEECDTAGTDVPWLTVRPAVAILAPGQSVTVKVTMHSAVAQPGTYTAGVGIKENTPYAVDPVAVSMKITPPRTWGKLAGTVTGQSCTGTLAPIPGATVQVYGRPGSWTFETGTDGTYAYWLNVRANPLQVIAAKDGYKPQVRTVNLVNGRTRTANFTLKKNGC